MLFDEAAKNWDTPGKIEMARKISSEMKKVIDDEKIEKALEFGCGTGLISFELADLFPKITLIDSSSGMIKKLNEKIDYYEAENMTGYCIDVLKDKLPVENFDLVYSSMAFHHIADIEGIIKKLFGLMKNEGKICIVDLNEDDGSFHGDIRNYNDHNGFEQKELIEKFEKAGFKDVVSYTFYEGTKYTKGKEIDFSLFILSAKK